MKAEEREKQFASVLAGTMRLARTQGNALTNAQIAEAFSALALDDAQLDAVKVYFKEHRILIGDDLPAREDFSGEGAQEGAVKTGYAYEYYRKLSEYTGWKYEYVYGDFADLYQMLLDGEIDLLAGLAWREDRAQLIAYPEGTMGNQVPVGHRQYVQQSPVHERCGQHQLR